MKYKIAVEVEKELFDKIYQMFKDEEPIWEMLQEMSKHSEVSLEFVKES